MAAAIVATILFFGLIFAIDHKQWKVGQVLFDLFMLAGLGAVATAEERGSHLFADERRNGTLGILFGTGISAAEVLIGKLAGVVILPLSWLLSLLPGIVAVWLLRGATSESCVTMMVLLVVLLALGLAVNLFGSLIFEEHSSARTFADALLVAIVVTVPALNWLNQLLTGSSFGDAWLALSPGYGPWMLFNDSRMPNLGMVHLSLAYSASLTIALFAASAWRVSRLWRDQTSGAATSGALRARIQNLMRARQSGRSRERIEANPYEWLVVRDFSPALISWSVVLALLALWLLGWWRWGDLWLRPINFWATFLVLSAVVRWMMSYIAARQIGKDRTGGTLELMLTTGLTVDEIVGGQRAAVRSYARPLFVFFGFLGAAVFAAGFVVQPLQGWALLNYLVIWTFVMFFGPWFDMNSYWKAFWVSLNTGRPGLAMRTHLFQHAAFGWIYAQIVMNRQKLGGIPSGSFEETCVVLIVGGCLLLVLFFYKLGWIKADHSLEKNALKYLRAIAAEPVPELKDPRLKGWDQKSPLLGDRPSAERSEWVLKPGLARAEYDR